MNSVKLFDIKLNKVVTVEKVEKSDAEWKKLLDKKQYEITTKKERKHREAALLTECMKQACSDACAAATIFFSARQSLTPAPGGRVFLRRFQK